MTISIVIPTYNEEKYIGKTLESVKKTKRDPSWHVEIVLIDAKSTDKTASIAKSYGVRVVEVEHRGIGYARQQGIKNAKGEIVIFTDADTVVPEDWIARHVRALQKPGVVFSYGTFRVTDGTFPYYHFVNYIQPYQLWLLDHILGKPVAAGQNLAFWKNKALEVGGFDENIRVMEDTDLAIRMRKVGKVEFTPDLIVLSSGRRSQEGWAFFFRMTAVTTQYFLLGRRSLGGFPDFR